MTQMRQKKLQQPSRSAARRSVAGRAPLAPNATHYEANTCPHQPREACDCDKRRDVPPCSLCKWIDACHDPAIHTETEGDPS